MRERAEHAHDLAGDDAREYRSAHDEEGGEPADDGGEADDQRHARERPRRKQDDLGDDAREHRGRDRPHPHEQLGFIRDAAGDNFADLEIQSLLGFVHITDDPSGIVQAMAGSFGVSEADAVLAPATLVGSTSGVVDVLEARRDRWQMSYVVVPIESTEALAPVVARLAGN